MHISVTNIDGHDAIDFPLPPEGSPLGSVGETTWAGLLLTGSRDRLVTAWIKRHPDLRFRPVAPTGFEPVFPP